MGDFKKPPRIFVVHDWQREGQPKRLNLFKCTGCGITRWAKSLDKMRDFAPTEGIPCTKIVVSEVMES